MTARLHQIGTFGAATAGALLHLFASVAHEAVTRKLRWSAKAERCAVVVALILTDVTISL